MTKFDKEHPIIKFDDLQPGFHKQDSLRIMVASRGGLDRSYSTILYVDEVKEMVIIEELHSSEWRTMTKRIFNNRSYRIADE